MQIYVEPFLAQPKLLIVGAGHVGKAVARLGKFLNFQILVSDDRAGLCTAAEFPDADQLLPIPMEEIPQSIEIDRQTYIVDVSRGSDLDIQGLPALLAAKPVYRGDWLPPALETTRKGLLEKGISEEELARIKSPVGLHIHAETPEEIAVSILAEIIAHQKQSVCPSDDIRAGMWKHYVIVETVEELIERLAKQTGETRIIAGGPT